MLIMILDKAKVADILPGCLFQNSSPHKSSAGVLQSLAAMLLPSVGDATRPLGHLNYRVEHVQYPLQEYTYHVENLATDLRDGVLLTRLVELLLYPPSTLATQREKTVTLTLLTGDILTSIFDLNPTETWVLSQHLKFPSIARAQRLYNAQIALSALGGVKGIPTRAISDVRPEDIVDGHREKTLSLLWALVGKWGLGTLVNWIDVEKEIATFRRAWYEQHPDPESDLYSSDEDTTSLSDLEHHKHLLKSWAHNIARLRGLRVVNLTTSFADGRVFEAIVDAYLPATISANTKASLSKSSNHNASLAPKLRAAGCSTAFVSLFTPSSNSIAIPIPSKDFTLQTLAFLSSRLLPLARAHRAASTIQRAFRLVLARRTIWRRVTLMRLATECAKVVRTRGRVVNAATVLQRGWRRVLEHRSERLMRDVTEFQARVRGWTVRRALRGAVVGRVGKVKERRVRAGW
jgi:abnormal spindle-like microcephaly-associated protein